MDAIKTYPKYVAPTLGKFLHKVYLYMRYGYLHYTVIEIPQGKNLVEIDRKIIDCYDVTFCRVSRQRRREKGESNVIYLRYDRLFILMATEGNHGKFGDIYHLNFTSAPYHFRGYSIGIKRGKPHLQISPRRFKVITGQVEAIALHNKAKVVAYFRRISPFQFEGVTTQKWELMKAVNHRRKAAGLPRLKWEEVKGWRIDNGKRSR